VKIRSTSSVPAPLPVVSLLVALSCLAPSPARAQELNYQTFLIGDRALGMGGAFTGLADDAAASWYNPAGLAQVRSSSIGGSLSVDAYRRYVIEDGYGSPIGVADLEHDDLPSVPLFAGLVKKFGGRDPDGVRRHAFALSTIHPTPLNRRFEVQLTNATTGVTTTLRITESDSTSWWGPSYAYRVTPRFALGASAFLVTRDFMHEEDELIVQEGARDPDGFFRNSNLSLRQSTASLDAKSAVFRLGAIWDPDDHFRIGLMVQPPGLQFDGSSRIYERRSYADLMAAPDPIATFFASDQNDLESESPIPWEVRLGAAYRHDENFTAVLDLSLHGPIGSEAAPVLPFGAPGPEPVTGETPQPGDYLVQELRSELTANVSLGMESIIAEVVPLRAGLFTNFSAAPSVEGPSDTYGPANVDGFGASLSVGIRSGGYDLAVGAAGVMGSGRGYRTNPDPGGVVPERYLPADVESQTLYFFLTGHKSAISRLAREVYNEYLRPEEVRERRERERLERERLDALREECEQRLQEQLDREAEENAAQSPGSEAGSSEPEAPAETPEEGPAVPEADPAPAPALE